MIEAIMSTTLVMGCEWLGLLLWYGQDNTMSGRKGEEKDIS